MISHTRKNRLQKVPILMMKIIAPSLLMLAATPVFAAPAINGQWKVHNSIAGNESDQVCSFTLTDTTTLSGSCKTDQGDAKVTGSLKDNKLSWQYNSEYNGSPLTLNYTATLSDADKITGTLEVDPFGVSGEFTATPVKADDATKKQ